jgi:uncharacterized protein (DUF3084 family)
VDEDAFPDTYRQITRRLRMAMEDPRKRREMELEDDIVRELQDKERLIEKMGKTIADKDQTIADKDQALADKDQAIAELEREIAELRKKV